MNTIVKESPTDLTYRAKHREWLPSELTEHYSNSNDPEIRSNQATASAQDAHDRLILKWAEAALAHAYIRPLEGESGLIATVAGLQGAWAHGENAQAAREELLDVLVDWATLKLEHDDGDIPIINGVNLNRTR